MTTDPILYWNEEALEANRRDFSGPDAPKQGGPTLSARALAIVHLAMYDAFAGPSSETGLPPYLSGLPTPGPDVKPEAAVAVAAHLTLTELFENQAPHFDAKLAAAGISEADLAAARSYGEAVARAMLADRGGDPSADDTGHSENPSHGHHREDPVNPGQGYHAPFYGARSKLFAATRRHELDAPPAPTSSDYVRYLRQVRAKGIATELMDTLPAEAGKRTPDETLVGIFWAYDGAKGIGTPPRLYNQIVRRIAAEKLNRPDQNARLFALVNVALADAAILCWAEKYRHDVWRPVLGVREHDHSIGPVATDPAEALDRECDPEWRPFGAPNSNAEPRIERKKVGCEETFELKLPKNFTPPFPAYPSGHAVFGAAALHMVRLFYGIPEGDRAPDSIFKGPLVSDELNGKTHDVEGVVRVRHLRSFSDGLWQMIIENGLSRVFLGVHWAFDAFALDRAGNPDLRRDQVGGVALGLRIAEDIYLAGDRRAPKKSTVGRV